MIFPEKDIVTENLKVIELHSNKAAELKREKSNHLCTLSGSDIKSLCRSGMFQVMLT